VAALPGSTPDGGSLAPPWTVCRHAIKVSTKNPSSPCGAVAHPYAVIEPSGDQRAVVCAGTICLAPVLTPEDLKRRIQEVSKTRA